jgi:hypothetical protein
VILQFAMAGAIVVAPWRTAHHPGRVIAGHPAGAKNRVMRGRRIGVTALLVLATLFTTAFGFSLWAKRQALDTDNWVDTSSALLEHDEIRQAVGLFIIDRTYQSDEVEARLEQLLPPRLVPLAKPAAAGLKQIAQRNAGRVLGTDLALQAWETANRTAHQTLLRIIESDAAEDGVSLQLRTLFEQMASATGLPPSAVEKLPPEVTSLQVAGPGQVETARDLLDTFRTLVWVLLVLSVATFGGAIALSPDRRRTVLTVGGCFILVGIALLAIRRLAGSFVVDALADAPNAHAVADEVWGIATSLLVDVAQGGILLGLFLVLGAWLQGQGRRATELRRASAFGLRVHPGIARGLLGAGILLLVLWGPVPWTQRLWGIAIFTVLAFLWLEWTRRQTLVEFPDEAPPRMPRRIRLER